MTPTRYGYTRFTFYFVDADQLRQVQEMCEAKGVPLVGLQFDCCLGRLTVKFVPKIQPWAQMVAIGFTKGK
jgi:hypothetical protein